VHDPDADRAPARERADGSGSSRRPSRRSRPQTARQDGIRLPGRAWRILPDRLLALRPHRRTPVTVRQHLALTALVLEQWGWAQTGTRGHARTVGGRRCILGAQHAVHALGYGDEYDLAEAGRQVQGALDRRGIQLPYHHWNELPGTTADQALALIHDAAKGA
jgi:hypothetical protein